MAPREAGLAPRRRREGAREAHTRHLFAGRTAFTGSRTSLAPRDFSGSIRLPTRPYGATRHTSGAPRGTEWHLVAPNGVMQHGHGHGRGRTRDRSTISGQRSRRARRQPRLRRPRAPRRSTDDEGRVGDVVGDAGDAVRLLRRGRAAVSRCPSSATAPGGSDRRAVERTGAVATARLPQKPLAGACRRSLTTERRGRSPPSRRRGPDSGRKPLSRPGGKARGRPAERDTMRHAPG